MKKLHFPIITLLIAGLLLAACGAETGPAAAPTVVTVPTTGAAPSAPTVTTAGAPAPAGETRTAIIGFTASQTGKLNVESSRQNNGLKLWMDQVNQAGGIKLA